MEFVIIMILFDVKDYRLLYDNCSISFSPRSEKIYKHDNLDRKYKHDRHGNKARMDTYRI